MTNQKKKRTRLNIKGGNFNNWVNELMTKTNKDFNQTIQDLKNVTGNTINNIENKDIREFLYKVVCDDVQAQNANDTCPNISNLSDDEIRTIAQNLAQRIRQEQSNNSQPYRKGKLQRTNNFNIPSTNNNFEPEKVNEFDTNMKFFKYNKIYNEMIDSIYNLIIEYKANNNFSQDKNLKTLMSRLVLVENAFGILRNPQNRFKDSFINILHVIKIDCVDSNYFKQGACYGAAVFGQASNLLTFLKEQSKILNGISEDQYHLISIDEYVLSDFINQSIPIILNKLKEIQHPIIQTIVSNLVNFSTMHGIAQTLGGKGEKGEKGGKVGKVKGSKPRIIKKKNILGKERNIYKVHGIKKECVNYKNSFIPVSEFMLIMKTRKNKNNEEPNQEKLSVMLMNIVLKNKS